MTDQVVLELVGAILDDPDRIALLGGAMDDPDGSRPPPEPADEEEGQTASDWTGRHPELERIDSDATDIDRFLDDAPGPDVDQLRHRPRSAARK